MPRVVSPLKAFGVRAWAPVWSVDSLDANVVLVGYGLISRGPWSGFCPVTAGVCLPLVSGLFPASHSSFFFFFVGKMRIMYSLLR